MKTVKQALIDTKTILQTKDWCQGNYARDANKKPVIASDPSAVSYCLVGAIWAATPIIDWHLRAEISECLQLLNGNSIPTKWNDQKGRTKQEVIDLLDKAIASCF